MAKDFFKKEPSKNEKMFYDVFLQMQSMEKGLWSTSSLTIVLAILSKLDPEAIAQLMVNGDEKIKEFSSKVNSKIQELQAAKQKPAEGQKQE